MKKWLTIIFSAICICAVAFLGYKIVMNNSIKSVELEGNMQTVYFANDDLDFENAKLKVTYNNGTIKMVDLKDDKVKKENFPTSIMGNYTGKLVYKSFIVEVNYNVIKTGLYYVSSSKISSASNQNGTKTSYTKNNSLQLINFKGNSILDYYYRKNSKTYLHTGDYDKAYNYNIIGDTINVYLGTTDSVLQIKAYYDGAGEIEVRSTREFLSNGYLMQREEKNFTMVNSSGNIIFKDDSFRHVGSATIYTNEVVSSRIDKSTGAVIYKVGETISDSDVKPLIHIKISNDTFLDDYYVHIADGMDSRNKFDATFVLGVSHITLYYKNISVNLDYKVVNW